VKVIFIHEPKTIHLKFSWLRWTLPWIIWDEFQRMEKYQKKVKFYF